MPRISLVIPTHNRAQLLPRAVESARAAGARLEILVVDDASTDETPSVAREMTGIRYLRLEKNVGLASARNHGIEATSGEFVAFLDDDDVLLPGALDRLASALDQAADAAFAYGRYWHGDEHCQPFGELFPRSCPSGDIFWTMLVANLFPPHVVLVRRSCLEKVGLFSTNFPGVEDWDLWLRLTERFPVVAVEEPVAIYRRANPRSGQMTSHAGTMCAISMRVHERAMTLPRARAASPTQRREATNAHLNRISDVLIGDAQNLLEFGIPIPARRNLIRAIRLRPLRAIRPLTLRLLWKTFLPAGRNVDAARPVSAQPRTATP